MDVRIRAADRAVDGGRHDQHPQLGAARHMALLHEGVRDLVSDAFDAIWSGVAEDDAFNQLVLGAGLSWRQVALLRAVSAYLRQASTVFTPAFAGGHC